MPDLNGIDHVHVYVRNREQAEAWYSKVMGFRRVEALMVWAVEGGPLTVENPEGTVHLALFESAKPPTSTVAFGASGEEFLAWKRHLEAQSLTLRITDHKLAYSLYFHDPFGNMHEITTWDHDLVRKEMGSESINRL